MIKIAVFDIDGTLYDERKNVYYPSSVIALNKLQEKGIKVAAATGRPPAALKSLILAGVHPDYLICSNGHIVMDNHYNYIASEVFSGQLADEVYRYCMERDIGLLWKYPDKTYVYINSAEFDKIFVKSKEMDAAIEYGDKRIHFARGANGGCIACDHWEMRRFNSHFEGSCACVDINGLAADLVLYGISKKHGLAKLLADIKTDRGECIAFGDNLNDLELIEYAGIGVCMGNGAAELKKRCDYVTSDIDKDGIYNGLRHYRLLD